MKKIYLLLISAIISVGSFAQTVTVFDGAGYYDDFVLGTSRYFVSESIYTNAELGAGNFITAGSAIQRINFLLGQQGTPTAVTSYNVYMKNVPIATTTFTTGAYTTTGYTLVFSGTFNATPVGTPGVILTTPFTRTANTNLQVLIERKDNVLHPNFLWAATVGNSVDPNANSSRTYSSTAAPVSGTTSLTATFIRPSMQFIHTFPLDAEVDLIGIPTISCFTGTQTIPVYVVNAGTTNIAAGAASTTLHVRGANTFSGTLTNTAIIAPGGFEAINFTGINLNNAGPTFDTAYVTLAGDGTTYNDTLSTDHEAATTLSSFPLIEDAETTLPVFPYAQTIALGNLWGLQVGDYSNGDQTTPLVARAPGTTSYLFDSYSGDDSHGFESRLYSNCINLTPIGSPIITFWMSHDNIFPTDFDSLYVSVSTDHGHNWTRILPGFRRPDPAAVTPVWRMHTVNLAAYNGQTIQIGFEGVSNYGNAISLDDITITGALPVSLLNFDAQRTGKVNTLTWKTAQEVNSSKFIVERSTDGGRNFAPIGEVAAAGNSSTERSYKYIDGLPVKGINYYRLRIVDLDNSAKYSVQRIVKNLGTADLAIAPNPVQQQVKIQLDVERSDKGSITIIDMNGKQVYSGNVTVFDGTNNIAIDATKFSPGSYIVRLQLSDEKIIKRFTKL